MKKNLNIHGSRGWRLLGLLLCMAMAGCVSSGRSVPAPVEDHVILKNKPAPKSTTGSTASVPATTNPAGSMLPDQAAKTGYYTVKPGDTLIRIGLDHGQNWRDIMRWNALDNPNLIEVGQVLRVAPRQPTLSQKRWWSNRLSRRAKNQVLKLMPKRSPKIRRPHKRHLPQMVRKNNSHFYGLHKAKS